MQFFGAQGRDGPQVELFMGLNEGTLSSLVKDSADASAVAESFFPQMLQALDCIAYMGIVHRDVKPENILYVSQPEGLYHFQLADFGLCNRVNNVRTKLGSPVYRAPEMSAGVRSSDDAQSPKIDVWALIVTMI